MRSSLRSIKKGQEGRLLSLEVGPQIAANSYQFESLVLLCNLEWIMKDHHRIYFRDELRDARAAALLDAEEFDSILFVIERLGSYLTGQIGTLADYKNAIISLAKGSALSQLPTSLHGWNPPFNRLFGQLAEARNDALHQGAYARHLTTHAIQVSLILEDALMDGRDKVGDFMVKNVVTASLWQPLSFIRQQMLLNSFSFLPVLNDAGEPTGELIADCSLACYLVGSRKERLAQKLGEVAESGGIKLLATAKCQSNDKVRQILSDVTMNDERLPILVIDEQGGRKHLIGLVTAFDLL